MKAILSKATLCLLALAVSSCNLWDFIDSPSGDLQNLAKARACLDQLDFTCAREYYGKLSSAFNDEKNSELAFTILEEQGVGMSEIIASLGDGDPGASALNTLANRVSAASNVTKRTAVFEAYSFISSITQAELKGLTRFAVNFALAGVILGEMAGTNGTIERADLVSSAGTCFAQANVGAASGSAACDAIVGVGATFTFDDSDATSTSKLGATTPTLQMLDLALGQIFTAFSTSELGASGKFSGLGSFTQAFQSLTPDASTTSANTRSYTYTLLTSGIGQ